MSEMENLINKYFRPGRLPHIWCPGCGNGVITGAIVKAIDKQGLAKDDVAVISGIGCSSRSSGYLDFNTANTLHGRALPIATGVKMANPALNVVVCSGDGDCTAIGGNHLIHAARRNIDLTLVVFNNSIYGMTGGQYSPMTPIHSKATTAPYYTVEPSFNLLELAKAAGATVVSVTHAAGSALTKEADYTIVHGFEANYAAKLEKMGYVLALAVEILQQVEGFDKYDKMIEGLTNVFEAAENAANSARKSAKEFAEKYKDAPVVYVMSSGASMEVAYSTSICLMMEMQWVNSGSFHSGEFFHGPFEIVDKDVPFILLMNDGKTRPVDARALTFLHRFDALTTVVDAKDYGLGNAVDSSVITYFNPLMHTAVFRVYAEELSYVRQHPLTLRRYMWKLEY